MYLENIKTCDDIKKLNINELSVLCDEIYKVIESQMWLMIAGKVTGC